MTEEQTKPVDPRPTKLIYSTELGKEVAYTLEVDDNNDILAKSTENDEFLKFPNISEEEIEKLIAQHNAEAETQVVRQPLFGTPTEEPKTEAGEVS